MRRLLIEWFGILVMLLGVLWALSGTEFVRKGNDYTYDRLLPAHERVADERIVLITIDERSVAMLGRWPWGRENHAKLLDVLAKQQPRAVLMDVLFTETSPQDHRLAEAMARLPRLALPVLLENNPDGGFNAKLPVAPLHEAARLGHIALTPDDDGVIREAALSRTDISGRTWPLLVRQTLDDGQTSSDEQGLRVPFNIPQGSYIRISYADVVNGTLPDGLLRDKYVLVGPTAIALGDRYPTPSSGLYSLMPGIEIQANVLDALLNDLSIKVLNGVVWCAVPMIVLLVLLLLLHERWHAWSFVGVLLTFVGLVCLLLWYAHWWWPPLVSLLGLILAYMVWTWRQLVLILKYVKVELRGLRAKTGGLVDVLPKVVSNQFLGGHHLERDMIYVHNLNQFVNESLSRMPIALCLVDVDGRILMHNQMARQILALTDKPTSVSDLVKQFDSASQERFHVAVNVGGWLSLNGMDWHTLDERIYQLHVVPIELVIDNQSSVQNFWQIGFVDLSSERAAQKLKNELVAFLSHDMRAPQVSILALLDLHESNGGDPSDIISKVKGKVHDTLNAAKNLVELARAQSHEIYHLDEVNMVEIIHNAAHDLWPQASAKQIELMINEAVSEHFDEAWVIGDGDMLVRALVNLLSNAVRYSPNGSRVDISLTLGNDHLAVSVKDMGYGMSAEQLHRLNHLPTNGLRQITPKEQSNEQVNYASANTSIDAAGSLGVGLHMVRSVVNQHQGQIRFDRSNPQGTLVAITLPRLSTVLESI